MGRAISLPMDKASPLRRLITLLMVLLMLPGWGELIEAAEHLVHDGHLPHTEAHEHAAADEEHAHEAGDEDCAHGCSSMIHACGCHVSMPGVLAEASPELSAPPVHPEHRSSAPERRWSTRSHAPPTPPPLA